MKKASIKVPDVFTRADDVCYGMIEVYPQDADGIDLTSSKAEKFEKLVPAVRAVCYNAPDMYYTLREIVNMANSGSTTKEISVYANEMVEKVENIFSIDKKASRALQLNNKTNEAEVEIREYEKELFISYCIKDIEEVLSADSVVLKMKRSVQLDSFSCGAQCVYMILNYFQKDKTLNEIKESLNTNESDGTDTKQILNYLVDNGLDVHINEKGAISSIQAAIGNGYPVLITVDDGDHWAVVYGYSNDGIFVLDSSRSRFLNQWGYGEFIKRWDENWIAVVKEK